MITQDMIDLYDEYTHEKLDRRRFMDRLAQIAGGSTAAAAALPMLSANRAAAAMIAEDDARISISDVRFTSSAGDVTGYLARPADTDEMLPSIIVVHENRGLNPHIQDVTRRAALAGFNALAPDFLSTDGGTPDDEDEARTMIRALDAGDADAMSIGAAELLANHPLGNGKVGIVGFCWGGGRANRTIALSESVHASVAYYGRVLEDALVPNVKGRMMLHYASLDDRINAGIEGFKAALDANDIDYTLHMYEGVNHAFHNDTSEARYDEVAAKLSWERTMAFFRETLREG